MNQKIYLNLTLGLGWLLQVKPDGFVRIQSTHLEQHHWSRIIEDLDYTFLLDLGMFKGDIWVLDGSHRPNNEPSRAIYQGLPWIRWCIMRRVFGFDPNVLDTPRVKNGFPVLGQFEQQLHDLSDRAKNKLDYLKRFVEPTTNQYAVCKLHGRTIHTKDDGNYGLYSHNLRRLRNE